MSVRPSAHVEQLGSHWADLHEIWYLSVFFFKSVEKILVSLKVDKNYGYFNRTPIHILDHMSLSIY